MDFNSTYSGLDAKLHKAVDKSKTVQTNIKSLEKQFVSVAETKTENIQTKIIDAGDHRNSIENTLATLANQLKIASPNNNSLAILSECIAHAFKDLCTLSEAEPFVIEHVSFDVSESLKPLQDILSKKTSQQIALAQSLKDIRSRLYTLQSDRFDLEHSILDLNEKLAKSEAKLSVAKSSLITEKNLSESLMMQLNEIQNRPASDPEEIEALNQEILSLSKAIETLEDEKEENVRDLDIKDKEIATLKYQIESLHEIISDYESQIDDMHEVFTGKCEDLEHLLKSVPQTSTPKITSTKISAASFASSLYQMTHFGYNVVMYESHATILKVTDLNGSDVDSISVDNHILFFRDELDEPTGIPLCDISETEYDHVSKIFKVKWEGSGVTSEILFECQPDDFDELCLIFDFISWRPAKEDEKVYEHEESPLPASPTVQTHYEPEEEQFLDDKEQLEQSDHEHSESVVFEVPMGENPIEDFKMRESVPIDENLGKETHKKHKRRLSISCLKVNSE